jgi:hypothetical protein
VRTPHLAGASGHAYLAVVKVRAISLVVSSLLLAAGVALPGEAAAAPAAPWYLRPEWRELAESITFYHSFDHASLLPDLASGDWHPERQGEPCLAPGLHGQALLADQGRLVFTDPGNWTIGNRGALLFWLAALDWNHEHADITTFVLSYSARFYLERQGPLHNPDKSLLRGEALLAGLQGDLNGSVVADCAEWKKGEWHMVALNWNWPQLALSLDGSPFTAQVFPRRPDPAAFGGLALGSQGGDPALMDEFCCFRRPLTDSEVRDLFEALRPRAPAIAPE